MGESRQPRPIVTLAALYGAGGSVVGPRVAERLGVEFFDRDVIAQAVASDTGLPEKAVAQVDHERGTRLGRFTATLGRLSTVTGEGGGAIERLDLQERSLRGHIEGFVAGRRETGGVVLGGGGMVVLRSVPWALHVYLRGPPNARVCQAASVLGIDEETAARHQEPADRARVDNVRRAYGVDGNDPSFYHLVLDSTALSLDVCVDIIVDAANARLGDSRPPPTTDEQHDA